MITLRRLAAAQFKGLNAVDLQLPERGSFLIEGRNEAGKSTLFDAVYFALYGVPLVGDIASAISYGADETEVRLDLDVSGTQLAVRRRARQTAKTLRSEAWLEVRRGDEIEAVKSAGAVTGRLQQELGGLTAEALLNSCLVAQKQLGRLETLTRASREEALTILLNLGKLTDVQNALRVRPPDEEQLRRARARVELARVTAQLATLEARRVELERQRRLLDVRDGCDRLAGLQQIIDRAQAEAETQEQRLASIRAALAQVEQLETQVAAWQRVLEATEQERSAGEALRQAERQRAEAQTAVAALPARHAELERARQARAQVLALAEGQARIASLDAEMARVRDRIERRAQLQASVNRLEGELNGMRRQRRELCAQIQQLAPLAGELEGSRGRLKALHQLAQSLEAIQQERRALEQLETTAADRAEADARVRDSQAALARATDTCTAHERRREASEARARLERARALLDEWQDLTAQIEAAGRARRLLADLALAVAGVEHISLPAAGDEMSGLRLSLVVDHPVTGALRLQLHLWQGGAALVEAQPASGDEAERLQAGALPALSATDDAALRAELADVVQALGAAGEKAPRDARRAAARQSEIKQVLAEPAPDYDEEAYVQARGAVTAARARLADAEQAASVLPNAGDIARDIVRLRQRITLLERTCLEEATRWQVLGADGETIQRAIPHEVAAEQQRSQELAERLGKRQGLESQLAILDRNGKERKRDLEECQQDLATDAQMDLPARQAQLSAEREAAVTDARRLEAEVRDLVQGAKGKGRGAGASGEISLEEPDLPALRQHVDGWVDSLAREVGVLEELANTLAGAETHVAEAAELCARRHDELHAALQAVQGDGTAAAQMTTVILSAAKDQAAGTPPVASIDPDPPVDPLDPAEIAPMAQAQLLDLRVTLRSCDKPALALDEREAQRASWAAENTIQRAESDTRTLASQLDALLEELGVSAGQLDATDSDMVAAATQTYPNPSLKGGAPEGDACQKAIPLAAGWDDGSQGQTNPRESLPLIRKQEPRSDSDGQARPGESPPFREGCRGRSDAPAQVAERVRAACPEVSSALPERVALEAEWRQLDQQDGHLKKGRQDAQLTLGEEAPMEQEAAQAALDELELDLAARRRAQDIVSRTRQRMIEKVLPDTITNMQLLLPLLTAGRYRHGELTPADYRLQVWDERKRGYVEKNLYSGGTQDQFSLALRLGFALAALPRELGTSPGFLFLDEPLSSFDRDRTAALVELLTHGQIATFFQQVLLISHSQAFDPGLFTYHIVMEEGQVVHSTLPPPGAAHIAAPGPALAPVESGG